MTFLVLGVLAVVGPDGRVVALSDRQRSLLASLLARAGAVVSVDTLVDLVWPEDPPQDPVAALHNQVSRLRRAAPFTAIETVAPGYRLAAGPDNMDSRRFDLLVQEDTAGSLSEALSLWHGAAYAEFAESPVARFEAIRLEEARRQATERWHELRLDQGSADLAALEAFAVEHPLRERAHLIWMRALYASGRQADALAAYQRYAGRLADELGLEPSADMQELQLRILRHTVAAPTPRSSIFQRLTGTRALVLYDRYGTGRSPGPVDDFGLDASAARVDPATGVLRDLRQRRRSIHPPRPQRHPPRAGAQSLGARLQAARRPVPARSERRSGRPHGRGAARLGRPRRDLDQIADAISAFLSGPR